MGGGRMKRYKRVEFCGVQYNMQADPNGGWVRYEDVEFSEISRITEIYEERIRELKDRMQGEPLYHGDDGCDRVFIDGSPAFVTPGGQIYSVERPECNCDFEVQRRIKSDIQNWWVCPAHGYKQKINILQPGIKMPECNCKEMTKHKPASLSRGNLFGDSLLPQNPDYWICPAHGYKKR